MFVDLYWSNMEQGIILTPLVAGSMYLLCTVRALTGLSEGVVYQPIAHLLKLWVPPSERATLSTITFSGAYAGTVAALPISALLLDDFGWQYIFYFWAAIGLMWTVLWFAFIYETPLLNPRISTAEQNYSDVHLHEECSKDPAVLQGECSKHHHRPVVSWCLIFSQSNIWACIAVAVANGYCFYVFLSDLPSYLSSVLGFSVAHTGRMALLPYIALILVCPISGVLSDWMVAHMVPKYRWLKVLHVRKVMCSIALLVPGACMVAIHFFSRNDAAVVTLMVVAVGAGGSIFAGFSVHMIDIGVASTTGLVFAIVSS